MIAFTPAILILDSMLMVLVVLMHQRSEGAGRHTSVNDLIYKNRGMQQVASSEGKEWSEGLFFQHFYKGFPYLLIELAWRLFCRKGDNQRKKRLRGGTVRGFSGLHSKLFRRSAVELQQTGRHHQAKLVGGVSLLAGWPRWKLQCIAQPVFCQYQLRQQPNR